MSWFPTVARVGKAHGVGTEEPSSPVHIEGGHQYWLRGGWFWDWVMAPVGFVRG